MSAEDSINLSLEMAVNAEGREVTLQARGVLYICLGVLQLRGKRDENICLIISIWVVLAKESIERGSWSQIIQAYHLGRSVGE